MRTMVTKFRDLKQNQITSNIEINIFVDLVWDDLDVG